MATGRATDAAATLHINNGERGPSLHAPLGPLTREATNRFFKLINKSISVVYRETALNGKLVFAAIFSLRHPVAFLRIKGGAEDASRDPCCFAATTSNTTWAAWEGEGG